MVNRSCSLACRTMEAASCEATTEAVGAGIGPERRDSSDDTDVRRISGAQRHIRDRVRGVFLKRPASPHGMAMADEADRRLSQARRRKMIEEDTGPSGVLVLRIISGSNLRGADRNGLSDPYVIARLPGSRRKAWRSRRCWKTLNPVWEQEVEFPGYLSDLVSQPLELRLVRLRLMTATSTEC